MLTVLFNISVSPVYKCNYNARHSTENAGICKYRSQTNKLFHVYFIIFHQTSTCLIIAVSFGTRGKLCLGFKTWPLASRLKINSLLEREEKKMCFCYDLIKMLPDTIPEKLRKGTVKTLKIHLLWEFWRKKGWSRPWWWCWQWGENLLPRASKGRENELGQA